MKNNSTYINSQIAGQKLKEILVRITQALTVQCELNNKFDSRIDNLSEKYYDLLDRVQKLEDYLLTKDKENAPDCN